ncbi:hypothetical protein AU252_22825 [Pseudarthrobacter sulfonivorans]|uniref:Uncharacterized protein n=1 Tax=Pseudarthrobacter sulfonivorans TaxID=121292 RepID=A0A0U3QVD8_9MICC|nr:hypothetical protein [Pseudarthrobacter sulfonivorans]ALV43653.1 hypothetical protein AU252_22825 [Pseudarthrobacter sulfonivorans]
MSELRRYRRRPGQYVVAVPLCLDTEGFSYRKWGGEQQCKPGDWLVDDDGDIHTVDADVFTATYRQIRRGAYVKSTPVWAEVAQEAGSVTTKEGRTYYNRGDFVVFNNEDGTDGYAVTADRFESNYEPDE